MPILSIVIPTRNRIEYVASLINSLSKISFQDIEFIIQDNSEDDSLGEKITAMEDPRFVYNWTKKRVDVVQNFSIGAELASGEYITFLGDDDGVNPEIVDAVLWCKAEELDALVTSRPAQYYWPDFKNKLYSQSFSGSLQLSEFSGRYEFPTPDEEMKKCAKYAGLKYFHLPRVYYGLVKRDCLTMIMKKTGTYFPGPSPDMAGAIAIANYVKKMCYIDYPLFLPGGSIDSGAGLGAMKKHIGKLEDWPHLPINCIQNWSQLVPRFFGGTTIWGEDVVQALRATGRYDILKDFNIPLLHAACVVLYPTTAMITIRNYFPALNEAGKSRTWGLVLFIYNYCRMWGARAISLLKNVGILVGGSKIQIIGNIADIEVAVDYLVKKLADDNVRFVDMVHQQSGGSRSRAL